MIRFLQIKNLAVIEELQLELEDGLTVLIGEENSEEEMNGCSLIANSYGLGEDKMGTIAVFGPKRMDYKNIISVVNHTAKKVSELLSERKVEFKKYYA